MKLTESQTEKLIQSYIKLAKSKGVFAFTFSELSKESGLSSGTLYRNVHNKDDVLVLTCIYMLNNHFQMFEQLLSSNLTMRERLLCEAAYPPYFASFHDIHVGVNFLGCNQGLIQNAQKELLDKLKGAFRELALYKRRTKNELLDTLDGSNSDKVIYVYSQLLMLSRGATVISHNKYLPLKKFSIKEFILMLNDVIEPLPWPEAQKTIRMQEIMNFMRSTSDQSALILI